MVAVWNNHTQPLKCTWLFRTITCTLSHMHPIIFITHMPFLGLNSHMLFGNMWLFWTITGNFGCMWLFWTVTWEWDPIQSLGNNITLIPFHNFSCISWKYFCPFSHQLCNFFLPQLLHCDQLLQILFLMANFLSAQWIIILFLIIGVSTIDISNHFSSTSAVGSGCFASSSARRSSK